MATLSAPAPTIDAARAETGRRSIVTALVPVETALTLLAVAVVLVLPPLVLHPLIDAANSAAWLGVTVAEAQRFSDLTVNELVFGPGTFAIAGPGGVPLYTAAEIGHLRDARALFYGFLGLGVLSVLGIGLAFRRSTDRHAVWRRLSRGGLGLAIGVAILGVVALLAFEPAFELFHRIFFPGGNFSFDPTTDRLVQLYPYQFWQLVSGLVGIIAAVLGLATWRIAKRRA